MASRRRSQAAGRSRRLRLRLPCNQWLHTLSHSVAMPPAATTRNQRERDLVEATRALFDERGLQDAPMDDIARAVGINKALIYRVFASKEELFVLTVTHYLDELREGALGQPDLRGALDHFTRFCVRYPAFL